MDESCLNYLAFVLIISVSALFWRMQGMAPSSVSRRRSLEETTNIGILWVSVNFILYFIWFHYMLYMTPSPFPLLLHPLSFQVFMEESCLIIIKKLYKSFLTLLFAENAGHCPVAVSAKADIRRFFRRHNEDQKFLCKCVFPFSFIILCALITCYVWPPLPSTSPPPIHLHLPLSFQMCMDESCLIV